MRQLTLEPTGFDRHAEMTRRRDFWPTWGKRFPGATYCAGRASLSEGVVQQLSVETALQVNGGGRWSARWTGRLTRRSCSSLAERAAREGRCSPANHFVGAGEREDVDASTASNAKTCGTAKHHVWATANNSDASPQPNAKLLMTVPVIMVRLRTAVSTAP
jgi:hypothetical protein